MGGYDKSANRVFEDAYNNIIKSNIGSEYLLSEIVEVHESLENRETKGHNCSKK